MTRIDFDADSCVPAARPPQPRADAALVKAAADALLNSKKPIIIAGDGTVASDAFPELRKAAEVLQTPVLTILAGRGSFPDDHPLAGGGLGLHRTDVSKNLLIEAEFVLGLVCRFEEMETCWAPDWLPSREAFYVQVDVDLAELGKSIVARMGVVSDIKLFLQDLVAAMKEKGGPDPSRTSRETIPRNPTFPYLWTSKHKPTSH